MHHAKTDKKIKAIKTGIWKSKDLTSGYKTPKTPYNSVQNLKPHKNTLHNYLYMLEEISCGEVQNHKPYIRC
jgi:hypothetical protein